MKGLTKAVQRMNPGWGPFNLSRKLLQDLGMVPYSCVYVPVLSLFHQSKTQILEKKIYAKSRGMNQKSPRRLMVLEKFINTDLIGIISQAY